MRMKTSLWQKPSTVRKKDTPTRELRDSFQNLLSDVCHDVEIDSLLQQLQTFVLKSTTSDHDARLDIKANGPRESKFNNTYFDFEIFNPLAK